jgi:uncharacterized repeat protein (TIGR03803 family)
MSNKFQPASQSGEIESRGLFMTRKTHYRRFASRMMFMATKAVFAAILPVLVASSWSAQAQTFTVLHTFANTPDGAFPVAPLIRDTAGTLYGTTFSGGTQTAGTVYKLDKDDTETVLFSFESTIGQPTGAFPSGNLIMDKQGNLYGTALEGKGGSGVVYKLTPSGKETILHNFEGGIGTTDPKVPESGLLMDNAGNLYGTTFTGGDVSCKLQGYIGCGVVFKFDPTGKETVLHAFSGKADGAFPLGGGASLVTDAAGNLYGAAGYAGAFGGQCGIYGCGIVFKIDTNGKFTVLHTFSKDGLEGESPNGALAIDPAGNLYGTTQTGGAAGNYGTIFEVSSTGKFTVLHSLNGGTDGATPFAGLIRDSAGNLYGTAYQAFLRFQRVGTVFEVTP